MAELATLRDPAVSALRGACLAALAAAVFPGLRLLSFIWDSSEYLGYGYLVPASSAALCLARRIPIREALRRAEVPAWGPAWVLAAAVIESAAVLGDLATLAGVGVPLMLAATAYALGGARLLRAVRLPIGFLLFMVPTPDFLLDGALLALKAIVIQSAVILLQLGGAAVAAQGSLLFVPGHELFVANACSGLRSIVTLFPLAVVVATFATHGAWRRALVVGSVVPLAIAGNIARVVVTVLLVSQWGDMYAQGALHDGFGLATFALGAVALGALAKALP